MGRRTAGYHAIIRSIRPFWVVRDGHTGDTSLVLGVGHGRKGSRHGGQPHSRRFIRCATRSSRRGPGNGSGGVGGGAVGASTILGARQAGHVPSGTMPHALLLMVGDTVQAAKAYDAVMPSDAPRVVLVDTFKDEAEEALRVAQALGHRLAAVRLDTPRERGGVTVGLVRELRARLAQVGFEGVGIFVSGGLTPERIESLKGAGVSGFGVGSYIAAAPPLDMTMDLKMVDGKPVAKRGRIPGLSESPGLIRRQG